MLGSKALTYVASSRISRGDFCSRGEFVGEVDVVAIQSMWSPSSPPPRLVLWPWPGSGRASAWWLGVTVEVVAVSGVGAVEADPVVVVVIVGVAVGGGCCGAPAGFPAGFPAWQRLVCIVPREPAQRAVMVSRVCAAGCMSETGDTVIFVIITTIITISISPSCRSAEGDEDGCGFITC